MLFPKTRGSVKDKLEVWRKIFESKLLKLSRIETEYY